MKSHYFIIIILAILSVAALTVDSITGMAMFDSRDGYATDKSSSTTTIATTIRTTIASTVRTTIKPPTSTTSISHETKKEELGDIGFTDGEGNVATTVRTTIKPSTVRTTIKPTRTSIPYDIQEEKTGLIGFTDGEGQVAVVREPHIGIGGSILDALGIEEKEEIVVRMFGKTLGRECETNSECLSGNCAKSRGIKVCQESKAPKIPEYEIKDISKLTNGAVALTDGEGLIIEVKPAVIEDWSDLAGIESGYLIFEPQDIQNAASVIMELSRKPTNYESGITPNMNKQYSCTTEKIGNLLQTTSYIENNGAWNRNDVCWNGCNQNTGLCNEPNCAPDPHYYCQGKDVLTTWTRRDCSWGNQLRTHCPIGCIDGICPSITDDITASKIHENVVREVGERRCAQELIWGEEREVSQVLIEGEWKTVSLCNEGCEGSSGLCIKKELLLTNLNPQVHKCEEDSAVQYEQLSDGSLKIIGSELCIENGCNVETGLCARKLGDYENCEYDHQCLSGTCKLMPGTHKFQCYPSSCGGFSESTCSILFDGCGVCKEGDCKNGCKEVLLLSSDLGYNQQTGYKRRLDIEIDTFITLVDEAYLLYGQVLAKLNELKQEFPNYENNPLGWEEKIRNTPERFAPGMIAEAIFPLTDFYFSYMPELPEETKTRFLELIGLVDQRNTPILNAFQSDFKYMNGYEWVIENDWGDLGFDLYMGGIEGIETLTSEILKERIIVSINLGEYDEKWWEFIWNSEVGEKGEKMHIPGATSGDFYSEWLGDRWAFDARIIIDSHNSEIQEYLTNYEISTEEFINNFISLHIQEFINLIPSYQEELHRYIEYDGEDITYPLGEYEPGDKLIWVTNEHALPATFSRGNHIKYAKILEGGKVLLFRQRIIENSNGREIITFRNVGWVDTITGESSNALLYQEEFNNQVYDSIDEEQGVVQRLRDLNIIFENKFANVAVESYPNTFMVFREEQTSEGLKPHSCGGFFGGYTDEGVPFLITAKHCIRDADESAIYALTVNGQLFNAIGVIRSEVTDAAAILLDRDPNLEPIRLRIYTGEIVGIAISPYDNEAEVILTTTTLHQVHSTQNLGNPYSALEVNNLERLRRGYSGSVIVDISGAAIGVVSSMDTYGSFENEDKISLQVHPQGNIAPTKLLIDLYIELGATQYLIYGLGNGEENE